MRAKGRVADHIHRPAITTSQDYLRGSSTIDINYDHLVDLQQHERFKIAIYGPRAAAESTRDLAS